MKQVIKFSVILSLILAAHTNNPSENPRLPNDVYQSLAHIAGKSLATASDLTENIFQFAKQNPVSALAIATATVLLARYIYVDTYNSLFPAKEMWYSNPFNTKLHEKPFIPEWIKSDTSWENRTNVYIYKRKN